MKKRPKITKTDFDHTGLKKDEIKKIANYILEKAGHDAHVSWSDKWRMNVIAIKSPNTLVPSVIDEVLEELGLIRGIVKVISQRKVGYVVKFNVILK